MIAKYQKTRFYIEVTSTCSMVLCCVFFTSNKIGKSCSWKQRTYQSSNPHRIKENVFYDVFIQSTDSTRGSIVSESRRGKWSLFFIYHKIVYSKCKTCIKCLCTHYWNSCFTSLMPMKKPLWIPATRWPLTNYQFWLFQLLTVVYRLHRVHMYDTRWLFPGRS